MTTINLYQEGQQQEENKKNSMISGSFVFSIALLVLVMLVYGGVKLFSNSFDKKNKAILADIEVQKNGIAGEKELVAVVDFQERMDKIKKTVASRVDAKTIIQNVALEMVGGVRLTDYTYTDKLISLNFSADNYQLVAREILNFKKSENFTGVGLVSINRAEKAVVFKLEMNRK